MKPSTQHKTEEEWVVGVGLWRIDLDGRERLAIGPPETGPTQALTSAARLGAVLTDAETFHAALDGETEPLPEDGWRILAPVDDQEVWAAGVTYERSREARAEESGGSDFYDRIYDAERPELFFKALGSSVRGPHDTIGVRADSAWDVPEPELGLVVSGDGAIVAYTIGNDVSSRTIEGANPLYLPQAKVYDSSCAIGPCLVPVGRAPAPQLMQIHLVIDRGRETVYDDSIDVSTMKRSPEELVRWLMVAKTFPRGAILLTGTALVPDSDFTLKEGDRVAIEISGLGQLVNDVVVVGNRERSNGAA